MLYAAPSLDNAEKAVIVALYALCRKLKREDKEARCWSGLLSRQVFERTAGNVLGLSANIDSANPVLADNGPGVWGALEGYRKALSHAMRPSFCWSVESILALHSMMMEYDGRMLPGKWRAGKVKVLNVYGEVVYEPPDADQVPLLMLELVNCLHRSDHLPAVIQAAILHLNVVRIHPFQDGNGRMARCLQASILLGDRALAAETVNLEEYVGQHIRDYNDALGSTGICWKPNRDTRRWIRFCLTAHYRLATGVVRNRIKLGRLSDELNAQRSGGLSDNTALDLGEIFGARPDVIRRWWRMRPDRVIERLMGEKLRPNPHDWPCRGELNEPESYSGELTALLAPASMDPAAPLPDPFKVLDDGGLT